MRSGDGFHPGEPSPLQCRGTFPVGRLSHGIAVGDRRPRLSKWRHPAKTVCLGNPGTRKTEVVVHLPGESMARGMDSWSLALGPG